MDLEFLPQGSPVEFHSLGYAKNSKICRLVLVVAEFLDLASPHPQHFCCLQAKVLKKVRQVIGRGSREIPFRMNGGEAYEDLLSRYLIGDNSVRGEGEESPIDMIFDDINRLMGWDFPKNMVAVEN